MQPDNSKPVDSRIFLVLLLPIVISGMVFLIVGILFGINNNKTKKLCTEKIQAEVVNILSHTSSSSSGRKKHKRKTTTTVFCPVFEFEFNDETYTAHTNNYSSPCKYDEGETYEIYFNPKNPNQIYLPYDTSAIITPAVFIIIGGAFVLICAVISIKVIIYEKKRRNL